MKIPLMILYVLLLLPIAVAAHTESQVARTLSRTNATEVEGTSEPIVAFAEVKRTPVFIKQNWKEGDQGLPVPTGMGTYLRAGEYVACGVGGQANIWLSQQSLIKLAGEKKHGKKIKPATMRWYMIPNIPLDRRDRVGKALANLSRAGRARNAAVIFWPADKSRIWPERLTFRWKPLPNGQAVSLTLTDETGQTTLWRQDEVDGHAGILTSDAARVALSQWRAMGNSGSVRLQISDDRDTPSSVVFTLMTVESETAMKHDLALWDQEPAGVFRFLGRASVFDEYSLDPEEADEFAMALQLEPDSALLRARTANAYRNYGNMARADELNPSQGPSYKPLNR